MTVEERLLSLVESLNDTPEREATLAGIRAKVGPTGPRPREA